ncbi:MAG: rhomboid family intramembrane serine protease [Bacteroidales bacterium]|nr:rhomboid family intramembrane serine protease [Bacteroidales bacterium]
MNGNSFLNNIPTVTKNIIIVNVIAFIATMLNENVMIGTFAMFFPTSPYFRLWQPITHMFMHGGVWHIFFNMYTLLIFGVVVERVLGSKRFLIFYFVCGLGAAALHLAVTWFQLTHGGSVSLLRVPMLGASGAIYGVLIAYAMFYPDSVLTLIFPPVSLKAKWFILIFAGIELVTGIFGTMDGIAHFAHLGGMLVGWLLIMYWKKTKRLYR